MLLFATCTALVECRSSGDPLLVHVSELGLQALQRILRHIKLPSKPDGSDAVLPSDFSAVLLENLTGQILHVRQTGTGKCTRLDPEATQKLAWLPLVQQSRRMLEFSLAGKASGATKPLSACQTQEWKVLAEPI